MLIDKIHNLTGGLSPCEPELSTKHPNLFIRKTKSSGSLDDEPSWVIQISCLSRSDSCFESFGYLLYSIRNYLFKLNKTLEQVKETISINETSHMAPCEPYGLPAVRAWAVISKSSIMFSSNGFLFSTIIAA